jgi:hypothetical protein
MMGILRHDDGGGTERGDTRSLPPGSGLCVDPRHQGRDMVASLFGRQISPAGQRIERQDLRRWPRVYAFPMKTISIAVPESEYEAFRRAAEVRNRTVEHLVREAMSVYREERLETRKPLRDLPVLSGHRPMGELPSRSEVYDEMFASESPGT